MHVIRNRSQAAVVLILCLAAIPDAFILADDQNTESTSSGVKPPPSDASNFYTQNKLHQIHLELTHAEWRALTPVDPKHGGSSPAEVSLPSGDERVIHRNRFPWAVASLDLDGKAFDGVGVRYKGNASFNLMHGSLKRNLKVKLDWTDGKQRYSSIKTMNLNAGGLDPSKLRDSLGYAVFRKAGLPTPRTTFAEVTLTVAGMYDRVHLGLFTLVEQVNKSFLKDRFKSSKGLLMKPEGVLSMDFRGDDWAAYADSYRPDNNPTPAQADKVIQFAKLVNLSNDTEFESSIDSYLDIEVFLRFIAVNALIVNLDTLLVMPHNYYVYLNPATDKFVFFPWDLDISFAGWPLGGSAQQQMNLSLKHPHSAEGHKLIDRLFAIPHYRQRYEQIVKELADGVFSKEQLLKEISRLENAVADAVNRDTAETARRNERGYPAPRGYRPPEIRQFVENRDASIRNQLAGNGTAYIYSKPSSPFGRSQLALHVLVQGDTNQDRSLSKPELVTLFGQWFEAMKNDANEEITKTQFVHRLPDALFPPDFPHSRPSRPDIPERYVAEGLFAALVSPDRDVVTKDGMQSYIAQWFDSIDADSRGSVDRRQLMNGFRKLIPR